MSHCHEVLRFGFQMPPGGTAVAVAVAVEVAVAAEVAVEVAVEGTGVGLTEVGVGDIVGLGVGSSERATKGTNTRLEGTVGAPSDIVSPSVELHRTMRAAKVSATKAPTIRRRFPRHCLGFMILLTHSTVTDLARLRG